MCTSLLVLHSSFKIVGNRNFYFKLPKLERSIIRVASIETDEIQYLHVDAENPKEVGEHSFDM